jgi:hypothetical protein
MGMSRSDLSPRKGRCIKGMLGMEDETGIEIPGRLRIRDFSRQEI